MIEDIQNLMKGLIHEEMGEINMERIQTIIKGNNI